MGNRLVLVYFDTALDAALLLDKPKLLAKLAIVAVLTLNGIVLHNVAFPMLTRTQRRPRVAAAICIVFGAISTTSWIAAALVRAARSIAPVMTLAGFLSAYAVAVAGAVFIGLVVCRSRVERLITASSAAAQGSLGRHGH